VIQCFTSPKTLLIPSCGINLTMGISCLWMLILMICGPSKRPSHFENSCYVTRGPYLLNVVDGPILLYLLWPKTVHWACHDLVHCYDARWNRQTKVKVLSDEHPHTSWPGFHVATLVHSSTLFKRHKVNSALVIKKTALSSPWLMTCVFLVSVMLIYFKMLVLCFVSGLY
jgi:hypothetical protein